VVHNLTRDQLPKITVHKKLFCFVFSFFTEYIFRDRRQSKFDTGTDQIPYAQGD
jgi:hypothetical protein